MKCAIFGRFESILLPLEYATDDGYAYPIPNAINAPPAPKNREKKMLSNSITSNK
jgi:hypothetical protein